jgi:hypothetical protein
MRSFISSSINRFTENSFSGIFNFLFELFDNPSKGHDIHHLIGNNGSAGQREWRLGLRSPLLQEGGTELPDGQANDHGDDEQPRLMKSG